MRAVVQRVLSARVDVDGVTVGAISHGMVVLLGVTREDNETDACYLADKIANLRIFDDNDGVMNRSVLETEGEILVVSQFTLYGDCRKGRRPSYSKAATPDRANALYLFFTEKLRKQGLKVATGTFQAMMQVALINDGPVTLLLDSHKTF